MSLALTGGFSPTRAPWEAQWGPSRPQFRSHRTSSRKLGDKQRGLSYLGVLVCLKPPPASVTGLRAGSRVTISEFAQQVDSQAPGFSEAHAAALSTATAQFGFTEVIKLQWESLSIQVAILEKATKMFKHEEFFLSRLFCLAYLK